MFLLIDATTTLVSILVFIGVAVLVGVLMAYRFRLKNSESARHKAIFEVTRDSGLVQKYGSYPSTSAFLSEEFGEVIQMNVNVSESKYLPAEDFLAALFNKFRTGYKLISCRGNVYNNAKDTLSYYLIQLTYGASSIYLEFNVSLDYIPRDNPNRPTLPIKAGESVNDNEYYIYDEYRNIHTVTISYGPKTSFKYQTVKDLVYATSKDKPKITPIPEAEKIAAVYTILKRGETFEATPRELRIITMTPDVVDLNYAPVTLKYKGVDAVVNMSKVVKFIPIAVVARQNLAVFGPPGTGKTIWSELALYLTKLELKSKVKIFLIPTNVVPYITSPEFEACIEKIFSKKDMNFIFIDECQRLLTKTEGQSTSPLLELMSGSKKDIYNLNFVAVFNADPITLDPALFRAGRIGMVLELKPLQEKQARAKLAQIEKQELDPETQYIDKDLFEVLLSTDNKYVASDPAATPYAKKGEMILADIYSCVKRIEEKNIFEEQLKELVAPPKVTAKTLKR